MSDFGDIEPDDEFAADSVPDPEQVARRLHELRVAIDALVGGADLPQWDDLSASEQDLGRGIAITVIDWLAGHEPDNPEEAARSLHNVRRWLATSRLPEWDDLPPDDRQLGTELMALLIGWLERQGVV